MSNLEWAILVIGFILLMYFAKRYWAKIEEIPDLTYLAQLMPFGWKNCQYIGRILNVPVFVAKRKMKALQKAGLAESEYFDDELCYHITDKGRRKIISD
jgi:hypothetical protein